MANSTIDIRRQGNCTLAMRPTSQIQGTTPAIRHRQPRLTAIQNASSERRVWVTGIRFQTTPRPVAMSTTAADSATIEDMSCGSGGHRWGANSSQFRGS